MSESRKRKIAFPMVARYNDVVRYFVEQGLKQTYIMQPPMTRHTLNLGVKYAPDMVCTPFKTILGSMIEALEAGADTLIMVFGYCRLGYYGELAETILRDLGYEFDYLNLAEYTTGKGKDYIKALRRLNPDARAVPPWKGRAGRPENAGVHRHHRKPVLPELRLRDGEGPVQESLRSVYGRYERGPESFGH